MKKGKENSSKDLIDEPSEFYGGGRKKVNQSMEVESMGKENLKEYNTERDLA
jgi:hypothetical protein